MAIMGNRTRDPAVACSTPRIVTVFIIGENRAPVNHWPEEYGVNSRLNIEGALAGSALGAVAARTAAFTWVYTALLLTRTNPRSLQNPFTTSSQSVAIMSIGSKFLWCVP
jgi:hypothetical protein